MSEEQFCGCGCCLQAQVEPSLWCKSVPQPGSRVEREGAQELPVFTHCGFMAKIKEPKPSGLPRGPQRCQLSCWGTNPTRSCTEDTWAEGCVELWAAVWEGMRKRWWAGKSELVRREKAEEIGACRGQETGSSGGAAPAPAQRKDRRDVAEQRNGFCTGSHHREASGAFPRLNIVVKGLLKAKAQVRCHSEAFLLILKPLWPRGVAPVGFRHECLRSAFWIIPPWHGHVPGMDTFLPPLLLQQQL